MKQYTVRITRQAKEHLQGIQDYITNDLLAPEAAANTLAKLKEGICSLSIMPERVKLTKEEPWRSEGIHRLRVKNYYIYFWINENSRQVQVIAVIYVSRDQAAILEQMT